MSFRRLVPKRASTRKRTFPVASSSIERREELDYDSTKNCILEIENDLQQLRKKLKPIKRNSKTRYGHDLGDVERHIKQDIHQHMRTLNQHFGLKYDEVNELERTIGNRNNEIKELNIVLKENDRQIASLNSKLKDKDRDVKALQQQFSEAEAESLQKLTEEEKNTLTTELKKNQEELIKLSAVAGDPDTMELSDPNRPMKIAGKFTEMYDNDWTYSMEALEDLNIPEEKCMEILLHFVTDSYEECGRILHELDGYLEKAVIVWECEDETNQPNGSSPSKYGLPAEITKPIKDIRRKLADKSVLALQKKLPQHLQKKRGITEDQMNACKKFIEDCIRYTWSMQMHDPPVYIEWEFSRDSTIDTNILRSYTRAGGDKVDFVVWPVLYLHKDGPVLNKGVVQPIPQ